MTSFLFGCAPLVLLVSLVLSLLQDGDGYRSRLSSVLAPSTPLRHPAALPHSHGLFRSRVDRFSDYKEAARTGCVVFASPGRSGSGDSNELGGDQLSRQLFGAAEAFGKMFSGGDSGKSSVGLQQKPKNNTKKRSLKQIAATIRKEYEAIFWATGDMDLSLWRDDCTFADPFSSFGGPGSAQRFKTNADNLGKWVLEPTMKVTSFDVDAKENMVSVGWVFRSKLKLPWRPVLAAAGTTCHYIDADTGLISRYEETWKSKPWDVIKRLFKSTV